jgi:hypothetical protein
MRAAQTLKSPRNSKILRLTALGRGFGFGRKCGVGFLCVTGCGRVAKDPKLAIATPFAPLLGLYFRVRRPALRR